MTSIDDDPECIAVMATPRMIRKAGAIAAVLGVDIDNVLDAALSAGIDGYHQAVVARTDDDTAQFKSSELLQLKN